MALGRLSKQLTSQQRAAWESVYFPILVVKLGGEDRHAESLGDDLAVVDRATSPPQKRHISTASRQNSKLRPRTVLFSRFYLLGQGEPAHAYLVLG